MIKRQKTILIICATFLVLLIIGGAIKSYVSKQTASVVVDFSLPSSNDTRDVTLKFNNKSYSVLELQNTYKLHRGSYLLTINKPGYKNFSSTFSLETGQNIIVNASLQLASTPPTITLPLLSFSGSNTPGVTISNVTYFYENIWAVVSLNDGGDNGVLVVQYNPVHESWVTVLGPGTSFSSSSTQNLPSNVQEYLNIGSDNN